MVVAGAGPGGLEAARVAAERGHQVVLFEAAERVGGQVNLATRLGWRENLSGIVRWLEDQVRRRGVEVRLGTLATAEAVLAEAPDLVVVATGGVPNKAQFEDSDLVHSAWQILDGTVEPAQQVLVFDDANDHQGASVAEFLGERSSQVEMATPDWMMAAKLGPTNRPVHIRNLHRLGGVMTPDMRLTGVAREGNKLVASLRNDYSEEVEERLVDQVVVEYGTLARADLYFALKPLSANVGAFDYDALVAGRPQTVAPNPEGRFVLYRIGDAVASRNIHAAIYDALRLVKDF